MLMNLRIKDFAIIDRAEVEFTSGFTVVTGETGAGKSILVDALMLALGARAASGMPFSVPLAGLGRGPPRWRARRGRRQRCIQPTPHSAFSRRVRLPEDRHDNQECRPRGLQASEFGAHGCGTPDRVAGLVLGCSALCARAAVSSAYHARAGPRLALADDGGR